MAKQFISEAKRMQKLANMPISEMAIPEMARTAGTGGAYTITEKGEEILKQAKASGAAPEGIKNSELAALVFLFKAKKDGKRVQKIDYAKERNVPQPAVNPIFNSLEVKELVTREGYTSKQQEPKTSRPRPDVGSMLGDLDIEEAKKTLSEDSIPYARWKSALENFIATNLTNDIDEIDMLNDVLREIIADGEKELMSGNLDIEEQKKKVTNKYITIEVEEGDEFPMLNKEAITNYLKSVIDPEEIENVDIFMNDDEGFEESSTYFFDSDEDPATTTEKEVEDWVKQEMSYYLFSKPDEFPVKENIEEAKKALSEAKAGLFGKYIEFEKPEGPEVIVSFEKPNEEELGLDFGTLDEIMEIKEIDGLKLYFVYV
jgi:hypothetical protein